MTCKDCMHYELCFDYTHLKHSKDLPDNREDICEHFKNKANFVELEQGEWINPTPLPDINNKGFFGTCSICEHTTMDYDEYHYCPNCGAKMKGGAKE